jgi:hypothetical protein
LIRGDLVMTLIRLFYKPSEALVELRSASWAPAFVACVVLSFFSNLVIVNAIGADVILGRAPAWMSRDDSATMAGLYVGNTVGAIAGLFLISVAIWLVLNIVHVRSAAKGGVAFGRIFTVCSYAAYAREAIGFVVVLLEIWWYHVLRVPLIDARLTLTNAAAFLPAPVGRRLLIVARSADVLMLLFLAVVAIALCKVIPDLRPRRAIAVVFMSWLVYVGIAVLWGR